MVRQIDYSFTRYLAAKKSVDDRALNQQVFTTLVTRTRAMDQSAPLGVLEIGAGIGTMIERLVEWGLFDSKAEVMAIDQEPSNIELARQRLSDTSLTIDLEAIDVFDFIRREQGQHQWDLLIAHAFLDLVDTQKLLTLVRGLLRPGALGYFTLNFDGATILEPLVEPHLDSLIERVYHQTMNQRFINGIPSGHSQTGRRMFQYLTAAGFEMIEAGGSDWVVLARNGAYPFNEAYFLHYIVHTIQSALQNSPELDPSQLAGWAEQRHQQIERGELVYIAHQLDFLAARAG